VKQIIIRKKATKEASAAKAIPNPRGKGGKPDLAKGNLRLAGPKKEGHLGTLMKKKGLKQAL